MRKSMCFNFEAKYFAKHSSQSELKYFRQYKIINEVAVDHKKQFTLSKLFAASSPESELCPLKLLMEKNHGKESYFRCYCKRLCT